MPILHWKGRALDLAPGESVLDALLRNGEDAAYSCKVGSCASCLLRADRGSVPTRAQAGLKDAWKELGYFLACSCVPEDDLHASPVGDGLRVRAEIVGLDDLSPTVKRVRLACLGPFDYRAGQYVSLSNGNVSRSYSIASLPSEDALELHVRLILGGRMSDWLSNHARLGQEVALTGPFGSCFYVRGAPDPPLLLAGTGTGLAPLWGIARDALESGHRGRIVLFHGAIAEDGLYLREDLSALATRWVQFSYQPVTLLGGDATIAQGSLERVVAATFPKLAGWRAYLAGDPDIVGKLRKAIFLAGAASRDILADAFIPSAT